MVENLWGRRFLDFHGNTPSVGTASEGGGGRLRQLKELPFCPRRFTNRPAVRLAEKLVALPPRLDKAGSRGRDHAVGWPQTGPRGHRRFKTCHGGRFHRLPWTPCPRRRTTVP
jgi:hypothetical protein